jgi:hypothetical protein
MPANSFPGSAYSAHWAGSPQVLLIGQLGIEKTSSTFYMAAAVSVGFRFTEFCITQHTTQSANIRCVPKHWEQMHLYCLKKDLTLVFFIAAILVCIPLSFYYGFANPFLNEIGFENAASKMTLGQVSEAVFILAIPFLFNRIGVKKMLMLGMAAWILRYVCFAYGDTSANSWMLIRRNYSYTASVMISFL